MTEKLDLTSLQGAIAALGDGIGVVSDTDWFYAQSEAVQRTLIAGVIQNFEMVYEVSVKAIRRQIELEAASPVETDQDNFRDVLRHAAEKGLIADVEAWFRYRKMRNITAHTYDQEKAKFVYNGTLEFLVDARALLTQLERRNARPAN